MERQAGLAGRRQARGGEARQAWRGWARPGTPGLGRSGRRDGAGLVGRARHGTARTGRRGAAGTAWARRGRAGSARRVNARTGPAGQGRHGRVGHGCVPTWRGAAGWARRGGPRAGSARTGRQGVVGPGVPSPGEAWPGRRGTAGTGASERDVAGQGLSRQVWHGLWGNGAMKLDQTRSVIHNSKNALRWSGERSVLQAKRALGMCEEQLTMPFSHNPGSRVVQPEVRHASQENGP